MKARHLFGACVLVSLAACTQIPYHAPDMSAELQSAIAAAHIAGIDGPAEVKLADRTMLRLQSGLVYIPSAQGKRLLRAMDRRADERVLGVVVSSGWQAALVAVIYAKDPKAQGIPDLQVAGWTDTPALIGFRQR